MSKQRYLSHSLNTSKPRNGKCCKSSLFGFPFVNILQWLQPSTHTHTHTHKCVSERVCSDIGTLSVCLCACLTPRKYEERWPHQSQRLHPTSSQNDLSPPVFVFSLVCVFVVFVCVLRMCVLHLVTHVCGVCGVCACVRVRLRILLYQYTHAPGHPAHLPDTNSTQAEADSDSNSDTYTDTDTTQPQTQPHLLSLSRSLSLSPLSLIHTPHTHTYTHTHTQTHTQVLYV